MMEMTGKKHFREIVTYHCKEYDTFGSFKLAVRITKGHSTEIEIRKAVDFYQKLQQEVLCQDTLFLMLKLQTDTTIE